VTKKKKFCNGDAQVFDESIQLTPYATVTVYRCPDRMCAKPCVTLRAFKMHAKCVHKGMELTPIVQEAKANFICKVNFSSKNFIKGDGSNRLKPTVS
jgi:hypothetical protein